jgi:hypothetical protein
MQALFVQKRNRAFLLVDQLVAVEEMAWTQQMLGLVL